MKGKYFKGKNISYEGSQLSPLWAYLNYDLVGDSIVAFRGPCSIDQEYMLDMEDLKKNAIISSTDMLHFVVEYFGCTDIEKIVLVQRLLVTVVMDCLRDGGLDEDAELEREYDNVFAYAPEEEERGKLSISIATVSGVSGLIHLGLNVSSQGTPVRTAGLGEIGIEDIDKFAVEVLRRFVDEMQNYKIDASKVKPAF